MRSVLAACLIASLAVALASCKCGEGTDQVQGPTDAAKAADAAGSAEASAKPAEAGQQVVCPVCGLRFGRDEAAATHEHGGRVYYFLLEDHQRAFAADPQSFLDDPAP